MNDDPHQMDFQAGAASPAPEEKRFFSLKSSTILLAIAWTLLAAASLTWNLYQVRTTAVESAVIQARTAFEKDVIYRRWNTGHGGVYAPTTEKTLSNPYLEAREKDITSPSGGRLTKINPAYMTRQVHELGALASGVVGHITSLNPIRPQNRPDPWEAEALKSFEHGAREAQAIRKMGGEEYLRFMQPLVTEEGCLACHAKQGYQVGDIRGGISVSVPMAPIWANLMDDRIILVATHVTLWILGLAALGIASRSISLRGRERRRAEAEKEQIIGELRSALAEVKTLKGFLPICANCNKIRDDEGYWNRIETYISEHSEAEFSHSICPDCAQELYPGIKAAMKKETWDE